MKSYSLWIKAERVKKKEERVKLRRKAHPKYRHRQWMEIYMTENKDV